MLINNLYVESIQFAESSLAHCIYHLLAERKISLEDDVSQINFQLVDNQKVKELIQKNVLGLTKVGIYSLKMSMKDFVFIFAARKQEAIQFYLKTFDQSPLNCHEYSLDYQLSRGHSGISFREMRKEFEIIPAIAGYFRREKWKGKIEKSTFLGWSQQNRRTSFIMYNSSNIHLEG